MLPEGLEHLLLGDALPSQGRTEKHVVTPGPLVPAREVLAQVLLASGRSMEAVGEFEKVLAKEPNRYRALSGVAQAAERAGAAEKAASHSARLVEMTKNADSSLVEVAQAKRLLGVGLDQR